MAHKLFIFLSLVTFTLASDIRADVIIANKDVVSGHLSRELLRSVFTLRSTHWDDASAIQVFVMPDNHPLHRSFVKKHLCMLPYQLRMIWERSTYGGLGGRVPALVESREEMLLRIRTTQGAIGYIDSIGMPLPQGIKIIEVD